MNANGEDFINSICNRLQNEGKLCTDNQICTLIRSLDRYEINQIITFGITDKWKRENIEKIRLNQPLLIADISGSTSWDEWLSETETKLKELGYRKYVQNHKNEDFCYWKTFKNGEDKIYQIGILFYDFRKYADRDPSANRITIIYECMLLCDDRIDMCVSKNINLNEFELMSKTFYEAMSQYYR